MAKIARALVSVSDKQGLSALAEALGRHQIEILSTGGTAAALRASGASVTDVAKYTGAPEILDGRVKTLHPKIHGGLLGRSIASHQAEMIAHGIHPIDLVVVNLYPFEETIARAGVSEEEAIENIDIGGPSMIRSAAKNHERVAVVVDPADYPAVIAELDTSGGSLSLETRKRLAARAFSTTAAYDAAIANWFARRESPEETFAPRLTLAYRRVRELRYGENPHQRAAFYVDGSLPDVPSVAVAEVLQGKELSYNNLVDLDAAAQLVAEFARPAVAIIKHTNPAGTAEAADAVTAYRLALAGDPASAFGGIVAVNRDVDDELGRLLSETFYECVIAPGFSQGARELLGAKKSLRLLAYPATTTATAKGRGTPSLQLRSVAGGLLVQTPDRGIIAAEQAKVVSRRTPTADELRGLDFAWRVCKHVKSNAIVLGVAAPQGCRTIGVGAGQMSRVDSVRLAVKKSLEPTRGSVLASDAFFPFRDGLDAAAEAGVSAVIQPGGSVRDPEVIAAADEHGIALLHTGMRHFRH